MMALCIKFIQLRHITIKYTALKYDCRHSHVPVHTGWSTVVYYASTIIPDLIISRLYMYVQMWHDVCVKKSSLLLIIAVCKCRPNLMHGYKFMHNIIIIIY